MLYSTRMAAEVTRLPVALRAGVPGPKSRQPSTSVPGQASMASHTRRTSFTVCWPSQSAVTMPAQPSSCAPYQRRAVFKAAPFPRFCSCVSTVQPISASAANTGAYARPAAVVHYKHRQGRRQHLLRIGNELPARLVRRDHDTNTHAAQLPIERPLFRRAFISIYKTI